MTPGDAGDALAVTKMGGVSVCRDKSGANTVYHAPGWDKTQDREL